MDLSHYGLLRFTGEDTPTFLQSQLSCDVRQVTPNQAQYGSYCTPKGRVLANFILWQNNDEWLMQLPVDLCATLQKRLSMFILRSKVKIDHCSDQWVRIGVAGMEASQHVMEATRISLDHGPQPYVVHTPQVSILCHAPNRIELLASVEEAQNLWTTLRRKAQPAGTIVWDWLEIQAGIPVITTETQEQFLPQMINLDLIGGVSFKKGCYPGQEIVARTQYLGKLKRRMYLAHIATNESVSAGDDLFDADIEDQSCGTVVNAAPSPDGGYNVLAVIQQSSIEAGKIYWKNPSGPQLNISTLTYPIDQPWSDPR